MARIGIHDYSECLENIHLLRRLDKLDKNTVGSIISCKNSLSQICLATFLYCIQVSYCKLIMGKIFEQSLTRLNNDLGTLLR